MTARHEHAVDADRPQSRHEVEREATKRFELAGARGYTRCKPPNVGQKTLLDLRSIRHWGTPLGNVSENSLDGDIHARSP